MMHLAVGATTTLDRSDVSDEVSKMPRAAKMDSRVSEALKQGISDLAEMATCHRFADQALNILRYLAKKWHIDVGVDDGETPLVDYDKLVKTYTHSLNVFVPNVTDMDYDCNWGSGDRGGAPRNRNADKVAQETGDQMDNPLFWPFPMQGRPILPTGLELKKAGFELM
jgi:hypothetical protein